MNADIYRASKKNGSSITHDEICRKCASSLSAKGYDIEFDKHLSKHIDVLNGVSYYVDDEKSEIECSECGTYLSSDLEPLEGAL